jgi:hypothetical protein
MTNNEGGADRVIRLVVAAAAVATEAAAPGVYAIERFARLLFLRERQLDRERGEAAQQGPLLRGEHVPRCHQSSTPALQHRPSPSERDGRYRVTSHEDQRVLALFFRWTLPAGSSPRAALAVEVPLRR